FATERGSSVPGGESDPAIQRRCPLLAASARLDAQHIGEFLDGIAQPDLVLVHDESREANAMGPAFGFLLSDPFFCHRVLTPGCAAARISYAADAFITGGATVVRRAPPA